MNLTRRLMLSCHYGEKKANEIIEFYKSKNKLQELIDYIETKESECKKNELRLSTGLSTT